MSGKESSVLNDGCIVMYRVCLGDVLINLVDPKSNELV